MISEEIFKTPTLEMSKDQNGYWLWDDVADMNLAMKTPTERAAFLSALEYYQERVTRQDAELAAYRKAASQIAANLREAQETIKDIF